MAIALSQVEADAHSAMLIAGPAIQVFPEANAAGSLGLDGKNVAEAAVKALDIILLSSMWIINYKFMIAT